MSSSGDDAQHAQREHGDHDHTTTHRELLRSAISTAKSAMATSRANHHVPDWVSATAPHDQNSPPMRCACAAIIHNVPTNAISAAPTSSTPTLRVASSEGASAAAIRRPPTSRPIPA